MKANIVIADRAFRIVSGTLLLASPLLDLPTYPVNLLGLVLIGTAAVGYCPLYALFSALRPGARKREVNGPADGAAHKV